MVATEKKTSSSNSDETRPDAETPQIEEAVVMDEPKKAEAAEESDTAAQSPNTAPTQPTAPWGKPEQPEDRDDADRDGADRNDETPTEPPESTARKNEGVMVAPVPAPLRAERSQRIFLPLLLGGMLSAILGFLASELELFGGDEGEIPQIRSDLADQQQRIAALEDAEPVPVDALREDLDSLGEDIDSLRQDVDSRISALEETISTSQERLSSLENRPVPSGESGIDTAAFDDQFNALQQSVEQQRDEIEDLLANARTVEEATAEAARAASAQAALSRIMSAIDDGQPYAAALQDLQASGTDVPQAIAGNEEGVTTLAALQEAFPEVARQALADARGGEDGQGFGGFLKRQLGARSVTPREGSDADAVLSRAEAALRRGDLDETLREIASLPEAAQPAVSDWRAQAETRQAAKTAATDLSQSLTAN